MAVAVTRSSFEPVILSEGLFKKSYSDEIAGPRGSRTSLRASFQFPKDWTVFTRTGGVELVDGKNGDVAYLVAAPLPKGEAFETVPKTFFADAIFHPEGKVQRSGTPIDSYKAMTGGPLLREGASDSKLYRRVSLKYTTVTANQRLVDRRGLVTACEVGGTVYMFVASANAVKWDKEKNTIDELVSSFYLAEI